MDLYLVLISMMLWNKFEMLLKLLTNWKPRKKDTEGIEDKTVSEFGCKYEVKGKHVRK